MMNVYCSSFNQDKPSEDSKRSLIRPKNKKPLTGKRFGLVLSFVDIGCVVQHKSLGKCPPTPPLTYHFALSEIVVLTLIQGRGGLAVCRFQSTLVGCKQERMQQCVVFPFEEMRIQASCHAYPHSENNKRTKH